MHIAAHRSAIAGLLVCSLLPMPIFGQSNDANAPDRMYGVCYGPFRDGESPLTGVHPTPEAMEADVQFAARLARSIRTYSADAVQAAIPELCQRYGIDCYPGAWLGPDDTANQQQLRWLIDIADKDLSCVKCVIVGNEPLHRHDFSVDTYLRHVQRVQGSVDVPVAVADTWASWTNHEKRADLDRIADLAAAVDIVMVQIYPYWDDIPIERATAYTLERYDEVAQAFPGKPVVLSEFGWPSAGEVRGGAVPSPENQARYLRESIRALDERGIPYFYFELFDERWKEAEEQGVGAHWGLFRSDGTLKPGLKGRLPRSAEAGVPRSSRHGTSDRP